MKEQGGYAKTCSGSVKSGGTSETRVKKPLNRNFSKVPDTVSDCSRSLKPKQGGSPE